MNTSQNNILTITNASLILPILSYIDSKVNNKERTRTFFVKLFLYQFLIFYLIFNCNSISPLSKYDFFVNTPNF